MTIERMHREDRPANTGVGASTGSGERNTGNTLFHQRTVFALRTNTPAGYQLRLWLSWAFLTCALAVGQLPAAVYYVSPTGNDTNVGSAENPWRTLQKAVSVAGPGDTVRVLSGFYPERVTTVRGGADGNRRIVFEALGTVVMRGWVINHPYVTVRGFDIVGHSHASNLEAYVRVNNGGSYFELLSCRIRDGRAIKRDDMNFRAPNQIVSPSGGFLAAGFEPGLTIQVMRGTNVAVSNQTSFVIADVTDHVLVIQGTNLVNDGPKPAYITGSPNYGILLSSGTRGCVFRGNTLSNLSYRYMFIQGMDHVVEGNVFENNNGWDLIFWAGTNHVVRSNLFRNLGWGVYEPSPDVFDNWPVRYENIHFTQNMVFKMIGVINAQKLNATVSGPLYIRHNVFMDVGWLSVAMPNTFIEQNTFVRVAKEGNVAVQVERHPVIVHSDNYASNAVVRNNIFVDCGQATGQVKPEQVGWYRFTGSLNTATVGGNFVASSPPDFGAKQEWPEAIELNGGDPRFVNMEDPLGPDGVPFTADDGLRLRPDSKLLRAGVGGATIGAYELPYVERVPLEIGLLEVGKLRLHWPESIWTWALESAPEPNGPWSLVGTEPRLVGTRWEVVVPLDGSARWFRLRRQQ